MKATALLVRAAKRAADVTAARAPSLPNPRAADRRFVDTSCRHAAAVCRRLHHNRRRPVR